MAAETQPFISVRNFQMKFGDRTVIEDLSFDIQRGEIFGFLGANGSGKTTTIRALLGIYQPTAGELLIDGKPFNPSMGDFLGYLPEERGLYKKESVLDTMCYFGRLRGMGGAAARTWSLDYLERVGLADKARERVGKLSGGQQQKVQLGVTVMNDPSLLILDEPTKGFDPVNRRLMIDIISERVQAGATVILVTHHMEEVERLCESIILLKDGRRRLYGKIADIRREYSSDIIRVRFAGTLPLDESLYTVGNTTPTSAELTPREGVTPKAILAALVNNASFELEAFDIERTSLDDLFVNIYSDSEEQLAPMS